jgi:prepilin-type N-terminal cleavage/methylation domain-containing protein
MRRANPRAGLTLLELLLALFIFGMLFTALNTFVFSMGELWGRGSEERLFNQHARAVTYFIDRSLRESAQEAQAGRFPQIEGGEGAAANASPRGLRWARPEADKFKPHLLTIDLVEPPHILDFPGQRLPFVTLQLEVREGTGLWAVWNSRLERRENNRPPEPRETQISPHVASITFDYYDADTRRWTTGDQPRTGEDGEPVVPDRIRFRFTWSGKTVETTLLVPPEPVANRVVF